MSYLPHLNTTSKMQSVQEEFRGLNHNVFLNDTELYDMKNMSVDNYPFASPRKRRGKFKTDNGDIFGSFTYESGVKVHCNGIASKQGFCFAEGTGFYYKSNTDNTYRYVGELSDCDKQFVSLGSYILIFPDKKYFDSFQYINRDKPNEWFEERGLERKAFFGSLEAEFKSATPVAMNMCNVYGEDYEFKFVSKNEPADDEVENGDMWLDVSTSPAKMMQYSQTYSGWLEITSNYIKLTFTSDITRKFSGYDGVTLSGFPKALKDFNSATVLYQTGKNEDGSSYVVVPGIISPQTDIESHILFDDTQANTNNSIQYYPTLYKEMITQQIGTTNAKMTTIHYYTDSEYSNPVYTEEMRVDFSTPSGTVRAADTLTDISIARKIPDMDFVCELDNRLWGCSSENHEIYSSKLGSPFNFNCFLGLSTDSGVITVGSDGDFTGCVAHLGYVLFFKEDCVHKIYGTKPTNYQVTNVALRGVQKGSERSICIVNETLFYKSKSGVMMFQGALPECISDELGTEYYSDAVAGACGNKYYISMKDSENKWQLFAYDTTTGLWHKEDNTHFKFTLTASSDLYYIDGDDLSLNTILGKGDAFSVERLFDSTLTDNAQYVTDMYHIEREEAVEWSLESGDLYSNSIDNKYISRLRILLELKKDTKINVYLKYDNEKSWKCVCTKSFKYAGSTRNTYNIPIVPRRSRRMKIRISGVGDCLIQAIAKSIEQGSEL